MTATASTDWTFTAHHNTTTTTLRIVTSDTIAPMAYFPENGATFDGRGRLATYPVWGAAYDDDGGSFISTRATVRVIRDYTGRIVRYVATDDFPMDMAPIIVTERTRADVRAAFGSAVARQVMAPIYRRHRQLLGGR